VPKRHIFNCLWVLVCFIFSPGLLGAAFNWPVFSHHKGFMLLISQHVAWLPRCGSNMLLMKTLTSLILHCYLLKRANKPVLTLLLLSLCKSRSQFESKIFRLIIPGMSFFQEEDSIEGLQLFAQGNPEAPGLLHFCTCAWSQEHQIRQGFRCQSTCQEKDADPCMSRWRFVWRWSVINFGNEYLSIESRSIFVHIVLSLEICSKFPGRRRLRHTFWHKTSPKI